jgi:hypothetical protein
MSTPDLPRDFAADHLLRRGATHLMRAHAVNFNRFFIASDRIGVCKFSPTDPTSPSASTSRSTLRR